MALYAACSFTGSSMHIVQIQNYWGKMPVSLHFSQKLNSDKRPWCRPSTWLFPEWSHIKAQREIVTGQEHPICLLQKHHRWNTAASAPSHNVLSEKHTLYPQFLFICASLVFLVLGENFVLHTNARRSWSPWSDQNMVRFRAGAAREPPSLCLAFSCPPASSAVAPTSVFTANQAEPRLQLKNNLAKREQASSLLQMFIQPTDCVRGGHRKGELALTSCPWQQGAAAAWPTCNKKMVPSRVSLCWTSQGTLPCLAMHYLKDLGWGCRV